MLSLRLPNKYKQKGLSTQIFIPMPFAFKMRTIISIENQMRVYKSKCAFRFHNLKAHCDFLEFAYFPKQDGNLTQPLTYNLYHYY